MRYSVEVFTKVVKAKQWDFFQRQESDSEFEFWNEWIIQKKLNNRNSENFRQFETIFLETNFSTFYGKKVN